MLEKIRAYIKENGMLERKDKIVIGVSGGADSVCLFFVLLELCKEYELSLFVVHINHGIRGAAADADEAFVQGLSREHGVYFESFRGNIPALAEEKGIGEEEAGRLYRYEVMEAVRKRVGANKIAVAHNENDCGETLLLNLFRGSGLAGMSGIAPVRGAIIRPLLCVSRKEIEEWLLERKISYRTDHTNFCDNYTRNRIRLHLLPLAEKEINEQAVAHTAQTAMFLREAFEYIEKKIKGGFDENVSVENGEYFIKDSLLNEDAVIIKGVLKRALEELAGSKKDLESRHIKMAGQLFLKQTGKEGDFPYGICGVRLYDGIRLFKKETRVSLEEEELFISIPGEYELSDGRKIVFEVSEKTEKFTEIDKNDCTKWFDYDKIKNGLLLRHRKSGDYIQINEDGGKKKLKDDLIDRKIPRAERDSLWLLADGSHILWVLGGRTSEAYRITKETVTILKVKADGGKCDGR